MTTLSSGTDPHAIDPIAYLSGLSGTLSFTQAAEELAVMKPALCDLYHSDRAAFSLAAKLVRAKLGTSRSDLEASLNLPKEGSERGAAQAPQLVMLADSAELFHTPDGEAWATILADSHQEHWLLKERGFRRRLVRQFYEQEGKVLGSQSLQEALGVLEGKAVDDGEEHRVFTRVAEYANSLYRDLANPQWQALEIDSTG